MKRQMLLFVEFDDVPQSDTRLVQLFAESIRNTTGATHAEPHVIGSYSKGLGTTFSE